MLKKRCYFAAFTAFQSICIYFNQNVFVFLLRDIPYSGSASWEKRKALELNLKKRRLTKKGQMANMTKKFRFDTFDPIECCL